MSKPLEGEKPKPVVSFGTSNKRGGGGRLLSDENGTTKKVDTSGGATKNAVSPQPMKSGGKLVFNMSDKKGNEKEFKLATK